ncbi:hypothetical protein LLG95_16735 [bacterium]|nr:hypothetical protein [bacterium]
MTVLIAVIAAVQIAIIRPAVAQFRHVRAKASISAQDLSRLKNVLSNREKVEAAYETVRNRITSNKTPEREIIDILQSVQQAAEDSKIEILLNVHSKDEPLEYFNIHTIQFQGRGELPQFLQMLGRLQDPQLGLKVTNMKFVVKNFKLEAELTLTRVVYSAAPEGAAE